MREITHEELKQIQLGILDKVHEFCEKNGITYFLSSGTLIGAVRHKGYIPWDDDLDLYMLRADYDKFIKLFSENSPENTKLLSLETDKKYYYSFAKVIDLRTEMEEPSLPEKIGVFIDIFPIENVPAGNFARLMWYWVCLFLIRAQASVCLSQTRKTRWLVKSRSIQTTIVKVILFPFLWVIPIRLFGRLYGIFVRKISSGSYVYNMSAGIGIHGCFRRSVLAGSVDIEFEGKHYKTMSGFREYLYVTYGDFYVLPPSEKRVLGHGFHAWWKV